MATWSGIRNKLENAYMDDTALKLGVFDQRCFYRAFDEFRKRFWMSRIRFRNFMQYG